MNVLLEAADGFNQHAAKRIGHVHDKPVFVSADIENQPAAAHEIHGRAGAGALAFLPRAATAERGRSGEAGEGALERRHQVPPPVLRTTSPTPLCSAGEENPHFSCTKIPAKPGLLVVGFAIAEFHRHGFTSDLHQNIRICCISQFVGFSMRKFSTVELLRVLKTVTRAAARAPVTITQHRKPRFVLMAVEDFDRLQMKNADPRRSLRISETPPRLRRMMEAGLDRIIARETRSR
jgi:prevent-host-death family protein